MTYKNLFAAISAFAAIALLVASVSASGAGTYLITKKDIPTEYVRAYQFLETLKEPHPNVSEFRSENAPHWDIGRVVSFISKNGVVFGDVNGGALGLIEKAKIQQELSDRSGAVFSEFAHLSHIYSIPYKQYSELTFEAIPNGVVVHLADWYSLTFQQENGILQLTKCDYLQSEED